MGKSKKKEQLGIDPGTASNRLVKDLLWSYIVQAEHHFCHQCGAELSREDFSIEHKTPWLDSENPIGLFFDLENIAFSHKGCNSRAARRFTLDDETKRERELARYKRKYWSKTPEERKKRRKEQYLRTGT